MKGILGFTRHLFMAMVKGFFFTGIAAGILSAAALFVTARNHQPTLDVSAVFALIISLLAAVLGSAVALIYHLSHLEDIHHAVQRYSESRAAARQQARGK